MKKSVLVFILGTALLALPGSSLAGVPGGTLRAHLESTFFSLYAGELDPDVGNNVDFNQFSFGLGAPNDNQMNVLLPTGQVFLGFGGAVIDNLLIGGRVAMFFARHEDDPSGSPGDLSYKSFHWGVIPYAEYLFLDGPVRPFVTAELGFHGVVGAQEYCGGGSCTDDDYHGWFFRIGAGGGAHFFLAESFSIDASMLLGFSHGGGEWDDDDDDWEIDLFRMDLLLGISGWI